jgi:heat shock protein HslJ
MADIPRVAATAVIRIILGTMFLTALGACTTNANSDTQEKLSGTNWLAEDINGAGVIDFAQSTLAFESATAVNGSGGCNRFFGAVEVDNKSISFGPMGSTRMACAPALNDQEFRYLQALESSRSFSRNSQLLFL